MPETLLVILFSVCEGTVEGYYELDTLQVSPSTVTLPIFSYPLALLLLGHLVLP